MSIYTFCVVTLNFHVKLVLEEETGPICWLKRSRNEVAYIGVKKTEITLKHLVSPNVSDLPVPGIYSISTIYC